MGELAASVVGLVDLVGDVVPKDHLALAECGRPGVGGSVCPGGQPHPVGAEIPHKMLKIAGVRPLAEKQDQGPDLGVVAASDLSGLHDGLARVHAQELGQRDPGALAVQSLAQVVAAKKVMPGCEDRSSLPQGERLELRGEPLVEPGDHRLGQAGGEILVKALVGEQGECAIAPEVVRHGGGGSLIHIRPFLDVQIGVGIGGGEPPGETGPLGPGLEEVDLHSLIAGAGHELPVCVEGGFEESRQIRLEDRVAGGEAEVVVGGLQPGALEPRGRLPFRSFNGDGFGGDGAAGDGQQDQGVGQEVDAAMVG